MPALRGKKRLSTLEGKSLATFARSGESTPTCRGSTVGACLSGGTPQPDGCSISNRREERNG